ncbi:copper homeostasis protein CutC [Velocimicrobium porci]|uniref:PF03932 family protein CutC n=1 Tax=Velocimicrobium porci TaxID=2606634 RepID=A0A6L5XZN2_9FIRM|nr:copper homeostasis protein CutC [Velocimicrobium porci]MSS64192.1 copper homeostasis protein CutC [Velocimicrobium porci]
MKDFFTLECCVDSVESALNAERGGATRIELCSNLIIGGTTPTKALFETIREQSSIRIHVLIRPRFGDFLYTEAEFEIIQREIQLFQELGAEGVVVGCLTKDGELDFGRMKKLRSEAKDMSVTLHRAFDVCKDAKKTLRQAQDLGINTILTSGQKQSAIEGIELLKELEAESGDVSIMAGAMITPQVIQYFLEETEISAYHMSGKQILQSQMEYRNMEVNMGLSFFSEYEIYRTDEEAIKKAKMILEQCVK